MIASCQRGVSRAPENIMGIRAHEAAVGCSLSIDWALYTREDTLFMNYARESSSFPCTAKRVYVPLETVYAGEDAAMSESEDELKKRAKRISSSAVIVVIPLLMGLVGAAILFWYPVDLLIHYNYLRGSSSLIDQSVLASLGSDGARIVVWCSCIVGAVIGLLACRPVISILNVLRRDEEILLTRMRYAAIGVLPLVGSQAMFIIVLSYNLVYGSQSKFLSDIGLMLAAAYSIAFCFPMLFKYALLSWYTKSTGSRLCLISLREDGASRKEAQVLLKMLHD